MAFPISEHQAVHPSAVLIAVGCGVAAALAASLSPVFDLRAEKPIDEVSHTPGDPGQSIGAGTARRLGLLGGAIILATTIGIAADPSLTIFGGIALAVAAVALIPLAFITVTRLVKPISKRIAGSMLSIAVIELEATVTRSVALAGVAALAIYGSVAIQGARTDLISGLDTATTEFFDTADLWVTTGTNDLTTTTFGADHLTTLVAHAPGVTSVRAYQGGLLDVGKRRLWIRARPLNDPSMLQASQLLKGNLRQATERLAPKRLGSRIQRVCSRTPPRCRRQIHAADPGRAGTAARRRDHDQRRMAARSDHPQHHRLPALLADRQSRRRWR